MPRSKRTRLKVAAALAGVTAILAPVAGAGSAGAAPEAVPEILRAPNPDVPSRSQPSLQRRAGSGAISAGKLERKLSKLARRAPGASGFYVYDIDAAKHRVLFDKSEGSKRKLASNEKLFTTTTALHTLGSGSRIETRVKAGGKVSGTGRLKGDIYLIGGGDPSFGSSGVNDLANDVKRAGIKRITGSVVGDDSIFDRLRGVPDSNFGPSAYFAPLSGLVYGGSTYTQDPAKAAADAFRGQLRDVGIKVGGKAKQGTLPKSLRKRSPLGSYESDTIAQLAAATNKPSNNFYAEMLLKRLDATDKHQGTTRGGARDVQRYVKSLGAKVRAKDGSGLTAGNKSSARDVVRLLTAVRKDKGVGAPLFDSLSIAGQDGTLASRMGGTVAAGRCRGKTGTLTGVSNVSGYCKSGHGLVGFSILMNGVSDLTSAHNIQDQMIVQIARVKP